MLYFWVLVHVLSNLFQWKNFKSFIKKLKWVFWRFRKTSQWNNVKKENSLENKTWNLGGISHMSIDKNGGYFLKGTQRDWNYQPLVNLQFYCITTFLASVLITFSWCCWFPSLRTYVCRACLPVLKRLNFFELPFILDTRLFCRNFLEVCKSNVQKFFFICNSKYFYHQLHFFFT